MKLIFVKNNFMVKKNKINEGLV